MKYYLFVFALVLFSPARLFAQKDADAKRILSAVSAKYKSFNTIKTDFSFSVSDPQAHIAETQNGTLVAQSASNKFKVTIYASAKGKPVVEQEIISDGKTQWTYLKKDNEVQVNDAGKGSDGINPAQIFTIYDKGYKYVLTGEQRLNGKLCQVVELSPLDTKKDIFKVRLYIDRANKEIYNATLFNKNGSKYTYTLKTFTSLPQASPAVFTFDTKAHPGVEVVDLR